MIANTPSRRSGSARSERRRVRLFGRSFGLGDVNCFVVKVRKKMRRAWRYSSKESSHSCRRPPKSRSEDRNGRKWPGQDARSSVSHLSVTRAIINVFHSLHSLRHPLPPSPFFLMKPQRFYETDEILYRSKGKSALGVVMKATTGSPPPPPLRRFLLLLIKPSL